VIKNEWWTSEARKAEYYPTIVLSSESNTVVITV